MFRVRAKATKVVAIAVADIHRCHTAPVARSVEPDWYAAQNRPLKQLCALCTEFDCPLLIAGDVFDRWNSPPELVNATISVLRGFPHGVYAIPGQHDLPNHRYEDRHRSAYWTLVEAGVVNNMFLLGGVNFLKKALLYGFPWGTDIEPGPSTDSPVRIAVIHRYCWKEGATHPGADQSGNAYQFLSKIKGYDVMVFGDNHIPFEVRSRNTSLVNCGCLVPRKSDECMQTPSAVLIWSDGRVSREYLDTSQDKWLDREQAEPLERLGIDTTEITGALRNLGDVVLDFEEAVRIASQRAEAGVREAVIQIVEQSRRQQ